MVSVLNAPLAPRAFQDYMDAQGFTDGLPVVPPTPDLVAEMVAASGVAPGTVVCQVAPSEADASIEKVAANAVMAGCKPEYMPVLVAALKAMADPVFNLAAVQGTTHPCAPLVLVNGPIRQAIGINCGSGVFGQGFRANATIGRAVRLILMNIGRALPGKTDMATMGSPAKFSFCAGENEEQSPWEPYHVEHGYAASDSTVLLHSGEAPHNIQEHGSRVWDELLITISDCINTTGNNNIGLCGELMLVLCPEHARILAEGGLSKEDVRQELHRRTRFRIERWGKRLREWYRGHRPSTDTGPEIEEFPFFDAASQYIIVVAGGAGLHSMIVPSLGGLSHATRQKVILPA